MLRVVILLALVVLSLWWLSYRRADAEARIGHRRAFWLVLIASVLLLVWRTTGMHWLAAGAAAGLAVLRRGLPWVFRALPFLLRWFRPGAAAGPRSVGPAPGPRGVVSGRRMSRSEALDVLGLPAGASRDEVVAQYRKLVRELHPDRGGSQLLTQQLNQARDVLLDK